MNPKVSVIIPVYNAGESIHACVQSLVNQTLREIELIFVLDAPTDSSDKVIEEYAKTYKQIHIIRNERNLNIGLSRNVGLSYATGDFVAFCDHDDIVEGYMYEKLYNVAVSRCADIVLGVPTYCYNDTSLNKTYYYPDCNDIKFKLLSLLIGRDPTDSKDWDFYVSHGVIWDNIYKRTMIVDNNLQFVDNNKCTFEDNLFLINCLISSERVVVYNKHCYNHIITGNNTSSNSSYSSTPLILAYVNELAKILDRECLFHKYRERFSNSVVMYITGAFVCEIKKNKYRLFKIFTAYKKMKSILLVKDSFRHSTIKPFSNNIVNDIFLHLINIIFKI